MRSAPSTAPEPLLTAGAIARRLGVSQSWIYLKAETGVLRRCGRPELRGAIRDLRGAATDGHTAQSIAGCIGRDRAVGTRQIAFSWLCA
jgi:hypothetical protein